MLVKTASRRYIAGARLEDARQVGAALLERGYWLTPGYWDGAGDTTDQVLDTYRAAIDWLAGLPGSNYLSIKLPALDYSREAFTALLAAAGQANQRLHLDSLGPEQASRIFDFTADFPFDRVPGGASISDIGFTLPGRWRRSVTDAAVLGERGATVRVVKGQWDDPQCPQLDPREGYLDVVTALAGKAACVRVATHDADLAARALALLCDVGTPCELELLYGLPVGGPAAAAQRFGVPVRVYVAFGHAFLPYALASMRKHPGTVFKLLKEVVRVNYLASFPIVRRPGN